ncbi:MAG TPA: TolC family protein [Cyclobacteriaceae bacterium]
MKKPILRQINYCLTSVGFALRLGIFLLNIILPYNGLAQDKVINVGLVTRCPDQDWIQFAGAILEEARLLLKSDYTISLSDSAVLDTDCDPSQIKTKLDQLLANDEVDIILGMDVISSHILSSNGPYPKPVIAVTVLNAQIQNLPLTINGTSGVQNLTYLELPYSPLRDLEVFKNLIGFEKLALIEDEGLLNAIPELRNYLDQGLTEQGSSHYFLYTENTAQATLDKLEESTDAVYLFPSDNLSDGEYQKLIDGVNDRGLKSFSIFGRPDVERGVLAGVAPTSNIEIISRRAALNIQRALNGEDLKDVNVKILDKEEFVINASTARKIDYSPSWEALAEAILINEERDDIERTIGIFDAISEGLEQNLNLEVAKKDVDIVKENVDIAKSFLLPEVNASAAHIVVDENTAEASFGQNPQNRGTGNLQLNQTIFSEQVLANNKIQRYLLEAQKESLAAQSLDVVLDVSSVYLNLMQAKTAELIQKENLELTRKNLELARVSSSLGQTGPSDLYRWQGEIANAKANLLNATATRRQAEIFLNQILNRPIDEEFNTEEINLQDTRLLINNESIDELVSNPKSFYQFADFQVNRAKRIAPDLRQVDYNVEAQERSVMLNNRNRYLPNVALAGNYNYEFYRGGSGSEFNTAFGPPLNDWNWNFQLGASLPIFQGTRRNSQYQRSRVQLLQLNTQRLNLERLIEQQVRSELEKIRASYRNITLTKDAEEAVVRNFEIVQDSYSKGVVTITQLLDAQNAAISAQLNSANAVYIFLIDFLNMERASGSFYMLMTEEQKADYINEITTYFNN